MTGSAPASDGQAATRQEDGSRPGDQFLMLSVTPYVAGMPTKRTVVSR